MGRAWWRAACTAGLKVGIEINLAKVTFFGGKSGESGESGESGQI